MVRRSIVTCIGALLFVSVAAGDATAGPPLLCYPFDIGGAQSLPWDGSEGWFDAQSGYNVQSLVADTEALLTPSTPVLVRMETLRRAAIYASRDATVAGSLLERLTARARASEASGKIDALAFHDAAYFTEALRQITYLTGMRSEFRDRAVAMRGVVGNADGYALVKKSLAAQPGNAALEFAAALIAADKQRDAYAVHAAKARAGAGKDPLLARNIKQISN